MTATAAARQRRLAGGVRAERAASLFLRCKGYRILARRFSGAGGEIDIIARRGDTVAFVEVKLRASLLDAQMAIDGAKRQRMTRAARLWLVGNPWAARLTLRGDAVYLSPWRWPRHAIAAVALDLG